MNNDNDAPKPSAVDVGGIEGIVSKYQALWFEEKEIHSIKELLEKAITESQSSLLAEVAELKKNLNEALAGERGAMADMNTMKELISGADNGSLLLLNELIDLKQAYELSIEENAELKRQLAERDGK